MSHALLKSYEQPAGRKFKIYSPGLHFFEKAGAPEGYRRRIGGLVSTDGKDKEDEIILQRGLDFSNFLKDGWYNDNHSKNMTDVLGYPEAVQYYEKGATLPDGSIAPNNGHWAEGYLLEGYGKADQIWNLGQALSKTNGARRLGFSIEGTIQKRTGVGRKTIAAAQVQNVAITHCPVNGETGMCLLAKSIREAEEETDEKALTSASPSGRALQPESLESDVKLSGVAKSVEPVSFDRSQAVAWFLERYPNASCQTAGRFVDAALSLRRR